MPSESHVQMIETLFNMLALGTLVWGGAVSAGTDFGTAQEARETAAALVDMIEAEGLQVAIDALADRDGAFAGTELGIHIFAGSTLVADTREPEMLAVDHGDMTDLTGKPFWPLVSSAAETGADFTLTWYHYDTQREYVFDCLSLRAERDDAVVMICR